MTTIAKQIEEIRLREQLLAIRPSFRPQPTNEPQKAAFNCDADEIGYGGAAGGGKTMLGYMMANYKHEHSVVFRRTLDQHGALLEIIRGYDEKHLKGYPPVYRPQTGHKKVTAKKIQFAHLDHDSDLKAHQGKAKDFLWFDEAVHFSRDVIQRLSAHLRPLEPDKFAKTGLKCQLLLTFNPPLDSVGLWVLDMFGPWINHGHPLYPQQNGKILYCCYWNGKDYYYESSDPLTHDPETGKELPTPINLKSRTFFKAKLADNEALRNNTAYIAQLQSMSEVERKAFLDGEMTASIVDLAGQIFRRAKYADAERRWQTLSQPTTHPLCISVDVTGGGEDRFVAMPFWRGGYVGRALSCQGNEVPNAKSQVDFVERFLVDELHCAVEDVACIYDSGGGYGNAFYDELHERYPNMQIIPFNGASVAGVNEIFGDPEPDLTVGPISGMPYMSGANGFLNKRSAAYVRAGQMLEHESFEIAIYPDDKLRQECMVHLIKERAGKTIQVISKEDVKAAIQRSPDLSDALVMGLHYLSVEIAVVDRFG